MKDEYGRDVPSFEDILNNLIKNLKIHTINCRCVSGPYPIISLYEKLKTDINYFIYN